MRHLSTTASLMALILGAGIANAQTQSPTPQERPGGAQQQQQRQQPSGGEERQRQPGQSEQQPGSRPGGQAQQERDQDRQRGQAQQQQDQQRQQPSTAQPGQQPGTQQRQPTQAQEPQQQRQQPSTAQPGQQPGTQQRQPTQAQEPQQQRQQPSTAQPGQQPGTQQRQPTQAQEPQQQRQQPSTAQPGQQPGSAQQPAQAQQQPAGSGEVSSRIASNPEISTRIQQSVTSIQPANVNVDVRVGASIPRTVELHAVPPAIIEIAPRYREYRMIRVRDEIVIVNPRSYEVVEVIRVGGGARVGQTQQRGRSLELTAQQRQLITRHVRQSRTTATTTTVRVTEGQPLTERVELEAIPQEIVTEVPTLREYRYFVSGQDIVIVDPSTNVVAEVIR